MKGSQAALWCLVVLVSLVSGQEDSLRSAIEAVSRRQRDLAAAGPNYYTGGLSQYRYQESDGPGEELAFLASPREFTGTTRTKTFLFIIKYNPNGYFSLVHSKHQ